MSRMTPSSRQMPGYRFRSFATFAAVAAATLLIGGQGCDADIQRDASITAPMPLADSPVPPGGADLPAIPTLTSQNGALSVALTAGVATVNIGGQPVSTTVYNGQYIAPTLRVRRGDVLRVTLVNGGSMQTNLHMHGLEVTPNGDGDNIFRIASPGASLTYEYRIPMDHPAGQFWYHPHVHGNASAQTKFGMSGLLIVEGMQEEIPALQGLVERVLVLKDAQLVGGTIDTSLEIGVNTTRTVNGVVNPTIRMAPGETQLWRVSNQSANLYYRLQLDGHLLYQVGRDGNRLNAMQGAEDVLVIPGSRADLVVQAGTGEGGHRFALRAGEVQTGVDGDEYDDEAIATVAVEGTPVSPLALSTVTMAPLPDLRPRVTNARGITFQQDRTGMHFMVNGKDFDGSHVTTRVRLGSVERWTIHNTTKEWHVFHIHQTQFQLVEVNGKPVPFDGYHDVVNVPEKGSVTVVIPFDDPRTAGRYVYHCHILDHEDRGMMALIQVGSDTTSVLAAMPMPMAMSH